MKDVQGGFFFGKKPLEYVLSVYTNSENAIARLHGIVAVKVFYSTDGKVTSAEAVSGPPALSGFLVEQIKSWTLHTSASGDAPCHTLVVVNFRLIDPPSNLVDSPEKPTAPEVFALTVEAELAPLVLEIEIIDPVLYSGVMGHLAYDIRRTWNKIFHHRE